MSRPASIGDVGANDAPTGDHVSELPNQTQRNFPLHNWYNEFSPGGLTKYPQRVN